MDRVPLDESRLKQLVRECKNQNVFPIFLSDRYPADRSNPLDRLLAELVEDCCALFKAMRPEEMRHLVAELPPGFRQFIDWENTELPEEMLHEKVAVFYIAALIQRDYLSIRDVISPNLEKSLVFETYPELRDRFDADGLLHLDSDFTLSEGGIFYKDHVLHYHQFLRRGFASNPNYDFIGRFARYWRTACDTVAFRIGIDHGRLMKREHYVEFFERDFWFGPQFNVESLDDVNAVGLTIHTRGPDSIFEMMNHLERTEFYWSHRSGIKSVEVEEISRQGYMLDGYYLNRYIHSERDVERSVFRHLDGAVKVYSRDTYATRTSTHLPKETRTSKVKVFRVDGEIELERWVELVSFFYRSNEMVVEYLNPEQFEAVFGEKARIRLPREIPKEPDPE